MNAGVYKEVLKVPRVLGVFRVLVFPDACFLNFKYFKYSKYFKYYFSPLFCLSIKIEGVKGSTFLMPDNDKELDTFNKGIYEG